MGTAKSPSGTADDIEQATYIQPTPTLDVMEAGLCGKSGSTIAQKWKVTTIGEF